MSRESMCIQRREDSMSSSLSFLKFLGYLLSLHSKEASPRAGYDVKGDDSYVYLGQQFSGSHGGWTAPSLLSSSQDDEEDFSAENWIF
jgi:hypothetical protein